jgi:cytidine deaminase
MKTWSREYLVEQAIEARERAYVPYSGYKVGAGAQGIDRVFDVAAGVDAARPAQQRCAERTAVVKAVSEGERQFVAIAVATENGGAPCGSCRQVLREFGKKIVVLIADSEGKYRETKVSDLLPDSFSAGDLA